MLACGLLPTSSLGCHEISDLRRTTTFNTPPGSRQDKNKGRETVSCSANPLLGCPSWEQKMSQHSHGFSNMESNALQGLFQAKTRMNSSFILGGNSKNQKGGGGVWGDRQAGRGRAVLATASRLGDFTPFIRCNINHLIKYLNERALTAQGYRYNSVHFKTDPPTIPAP